MNRASTSSDAGAPRAERDRLHTGRRRFVQGSALAFGAAGLATPDLLGKRRVVTAGSSPRTIAPGDIVLFQGDSITDAGRKRGIDAANDQPAMGRGYAWLAASQLLVDRPGDNLRCFNRGISGNKVHQLAARWEKDCLALKPNVLSVLIGVNDIWHKLNGNYDGTVEVYERDYDALFARTREAIPAIKLVVCEPFVLRCGAVKPDKWFPAFDGYRAAAHRVADKHGATFVAFQSMFDRAAEIAPPEHWARDGVHPSANGASLMAHHWLAAVGG